MKSRRRMILVLALAATVGLSLMSLTWTPESGAPGAMSELVQPVQRVHAATLQRQAPAAKPEETAPPDDSLQIRVRPASSQQPRDLFAAYSWQPPPPPPPPPAPPPPPTAPPLPFAYAGRLDIDDKPLYLLLQGERTLRIAMGGTIGEFMLTASGPQGLVFLHRPTGLTETLVAPGVPVASYSPSPSP